MGVKTYQAYTMAEALGTAKRDLGPDAVILETRTFKRGGLLGVGRRTICELTATSNDRADAVRVARPSAAPGAQRAAATAAYGDGPGDEKPDLVRTQRLAQALLEKHEREAPGIRSGTDPGAMLGGDPSGSRQACEFEVSATHAVPDDSCADARVLRAKPTQTPASYGRRTGTKHGTTGDAGTTDVAGLKPDIPTARSSFEESNRGPSAPVARRFILTSAEPSTGRHARRSPSPGHQRVTALVEPDSDAMQHELSAIKTMVGQVLRRQTEVGPARPAVPPDMPQQLFDMYLELIGQDLSEELADRIVRAVRGELHQEQWDDPKLVREALVRHLAELVPAADGSVPQRSPDDRPLTIALIGPTGVGKTTTLAKLAASFKLRQHRRVGLLTCDTYRIAAVDQLRTYANIIGLPLEIALTPPEMRQAVHALRDCDVVLIDTAGRGPNDRGRLDELHTCLAAVDPHEVHLVLSSTSSQRVLMREAEAFAVLGADRVVLTKLDEAVSFGVLINVMQAVGKKLSFVTTGQEVPDHLEIGRPRRLAELVLGAPLHS
ncbi:MAG: flagellar biosynthesis protein FlhF [Planctomycetota bacterium]|jgi:flagellar biosynthesis protein FlhF